MQFTGRFGGFNLLILVALIAFPLHLHAQYSNQFEEQDFGVNFIQPDWNEDYPNEIHPFSCRKANRSQIAQVNLGNSKLQQFLRECEMQTNGSHWCNQVIRPNPASAAIFSCTYGAHQPHTLVHPDERTWPNAFQAVRLVEALEDEGIKPCLIYNWWRPEPYNANVSGAPGRHPFGTSVDVRFCSMKDMERAFTQLCTWRSQGKLRAVGYYGSTGLHFGIGDKVGNTWGKRCPPALAQNG
jgi:hypothetical protein